MGQLSYINCYFCSSTPQISRQESANPGFAERQGDLNPQILGPESASSGSAKRQSDSRGDS